MIRYRHSYSCVSHARQTKEIDLDRYDPRTSLQREMSSVGVRAQEHELPSLLGLVLQPVSSFLKKDTLHQHSWLQGNCFESSKLAFEEKLNLQLRDLSRFLHSSHLQPPTFYRKLKGRDVVEAVFGRTVLRFAAMFAAWAALYKATHNSLRLLTSTHSIKPHRSQSDPKGLSLENPPLAASQEPDSVLPSGATTPQHLDLSEEELAKKKADSKRKMFMGDPRSRVWHAYLAGAVSSVAILFEEKSERISLAQQLFVRGLEGTYNVAHSRGKINIPHGAVLAFGLACGQIMYAWFVSK